VVGVEVGLSATLLGAEPDGCDLLLLSVLDGGIAKEELGACALPAELGKADLLLEPGGDRGDETSGAVVAGATVVVGFDVGLSAGGAERRDEREDGRWAAPPACCRI
jgi:hypothetical protein